MKKHIRKLFDEYYKYMNQYKESQREYHRELAYRRLTKIIADIKK